jgi:hypothetical protein
MFDLISGQFISQSLHFGVNLFAALACIAAAWLYLDAWSERHHGGELAKGGGFLMLAVAFLITGATWGEPGLLGLASNTLKLLGYLAIATGMISTPLQPRPKTTGYTPAMLIGPAAVSISLSAMVPLAALAVGLVYWRLATTGLERHLKPLAIAFTIFAVSHALALASLWGASDNPLLQSLAKPLGTFWILEHITLLLASAMLARWVWRYLTKRLLSQLFLTITSLTFAIVLIATTSVAALLLSSLQHDSLSSLATAAKVLGYAVDSKTAEGRAGTDVLAKDPELIQAVSSRDYVALTKLTSSALTAQQFSDVIVTDEAGLVLTRASDPERFGDSLSGDALVQRALTGTPSSSITARSNTLSSTLAITTASPIYSQDQIIGTATTSLALDNAFVDGLKHTTGLDSTIYSGTIRAATTFTGPNGTSRSLGTKETNTSVINKTINQGQLWQGIINTGSQPYLAIYLPLSDINHRVVGMLSVGMPQAVVLASAKEAIKLTFIGAVVALLLIMLPVYLVARQISRQLK